MEGGEYTTTNAATLLLCLSGLRGGEGMASRWTPTRRSGPPPGLFKSSDNYPRQFYTSSVFSDISSTFHILPRTTVLSLPGVFWIRSRDTPDSLQTGEYYMYMLNPGQTPLFEEIKTYTFWLVSQIRPYPENMEFKGQLENHKRKDLWRDILF